MPVKLSFSVHVDTSNASDNSHGSNNDRCFSIQWNKANEGDIINYKRILDDILSKSITYEAIHCESVRCNDNGHHAAIEKMCKNVIDACLKAGNMGILTSSGRRSTDGRKCIRGWNEFLKPARENSMFWHWMWLECKKPNAGVVCDCMRRSRRAYHSAIRTTRQIEKDIQKEKVAEHCQEKSAKNLPQMCQAD